MSYNITTIQISVHGQINTKETNNESSPTCFHTIHFQNKKFSIKMKLCSSQLSDIDSG